MAHDDEYRIKRSEITAEVKWTILDAFWGLYDDHPYFTLKEACKWAGVNPSWVRDWAKDDHCWLEMVDLFDRDTVLPRVESV